MYHETTVRNSPSTFLSHIFTLTRWLGVFPFYSKSTAIQNYFVKCKHALLYSYLPFILTIVNVIFLLRHRFDSYYGHYFVIIIEMLTHVNILVYVTIPYVQCKSICEALDGCFYVSKINTKSNNCYPQVIIVLLFVCWNFFCLLQLKDTTYASFSLIPLYMEKFIIGLLETQLCLLLYTVKMGIAQINRDITEEILRQEDDIGKLYDITYWRFSKPEGKMSGSLPTEHFRKLHMIMFATMEGLNKSYGFGNLLLTLRERLSFAFYLYFWITRNQMLDLILASINFLKVGMIFYCFQTLKNEETELKSKVNELLSQYSNSEERRKILTTTAGYLLLLSQLRL